MPIIGSILLLMLSASILAVIVSDSLKSTCYILSTRNIFLLGFLLFQSGSATFTLLTGANEANLYLNYPGKTGIIFFILCTCFISIFLFTYKHCGNLMPSAFIPRPRRIVSSSAMVGIAFFALAFGLLCRFVLSQIPVIGQIPIELAVGCFSLACCLMVWEWGKQSWNPMLGALLLLAITVSVLALLVNAFGRREILGIFMCMAWMLFYLKWRTLSLGNLLGRVAIWGTLIVTITVVFSSARSGGEKNRSAAEYLQAIGNISMNDIEEQLMGGLSGQFAGGISMWIYETRPDDFAYDTLHTVRYIVTLPIPRESYPGKPNSLGKLLVKQAMITRVGDDHNLGPGLIGHTINDFPWIALPLYAIGLALIFRYIDTRVASNCQDPFQVAILGAGISQILALGRGELGQFLVLMFCYMAGAWFIIQFISLFLSSEFAESEDVEFSEDEAAEEA